MPEQPRGKRRTIMSWLQFRLWQLLVLVTIVASIVGVYVVAENRVVEVENAVTVIESFGGSVEYEIVGPGWLPERYRQRVVVAGIRESFPQGIFLDEPVIMGDVNSGTNSTSQPSREFTHDDVRTAISKFRHLRALYLTPDYSSSKLNLVKDFRKDWPLKELFIAGEVSLNNEDCQRLRSYRMLKSLSIYDLNENQIDYSFLEALPKLESLDLSASNISDNDLKHLAELHHLTELNLRRTGVHGPGLAHLNRLRNLQNLDLSYSTLHGRHPWDPSGTGSTPDPGRFRSMRQLPRLPALERLTLSETILDEASLVAIGRQRNLKDLNLSCCRLQGDWLRHLVNPKLEEVNIFTATIDRTGLEAICQITSLRRLHASAIDCSANELAVVLPQASQLTYFACDVEDYTPALIAALKQLPHLEEVYNPNNSMILEDILAMQDE